MSTRDDDAVAISNSKIAVLAPCIGGPGGDADEDEWPENLISRRAVVYEDGVIARVGETVQHRHDADELALCTRLACEAMAIMQHVPVGMESESDTPFSPFFIPAPFGEPQATQIDEAGIRRAFGGTIFPLATITVEPLRETGIWWEEVLRDGAGQAASYFEPWRRLLTWFARQEAFVDAAFVRIGDRRALDELEESDYPEGVESTGCVLPRLAVGLTRAGSLAGLFGYAVQT